MWIPITTIIALGLCWITSTITDYLHTRDTNGISALKKENKLLKEIVDGLIKNKGENNEQR